DDAARGERVARLLALHQDDRAAWRGGPDLVDAVERQVARLHVEALLPVRPLPDALLPLPVATGVGAHRDGGERPGRVTDRPAPGLALRRWPRDAEAFGGVERAALRATGAA